MESEQRAKRSIGDVEPTSSPEFMDRIVSKTARFVSPLKETQSAVLSPTLEQVFTSMGDVQNSGQMAEIGESDALSSQTLKENLPSDCPDFIIKLGQILMKFQAVQTATIRSDVSGVKDSLEFISKECSEAKTLSGKNETRIEKLEETCQELDKENKKLWKRVISNEVRDRRNNLKFYGVAPVEDEDLRKWFVGVLKDPLKFTDAEIEKIELERIHRMGPGQKTIIMKFLRFTDREEVWSRRKKLGGSGMVVAEDFPEEIEKRRTPLYPVLRAALKQKKKFKPKLKIDRLIISGKTYTVDNIEELPQELKPENICIEKEDNYSFFFGKECPLSNFYPSVFVVDNIEYNSGEQFLQKTKASFCGDHQKVKEIMSATNPAEQKYLGSKVSNFEQRKWERSAAEIVKRGLYEKFRQNPKLFDVLRSTGHTVLVECNRNDSFWAIGLGMGSKIKTDPGRWKGCNALGTILTQIRDELNAAP